jgi:zinc transport system permease protein
MNLPLPWPFEREYMQLALLAGLIVGACAPLIGTFLVQKQLSLLGDGMGHLAFAGVSAGFLLDIWPLWSALAVALSGGLVLEWVRGRGRAGGDLALALIFYSGIAGGVVLASRAGSLGTGLVEYLFGSILTVSTGDAWAVACLGAFIVGAVLISWRALLAVVLDEEAARVAGMPVDFLNMALAALTAITVVAAMRVVGVLLVAALMVLPVGAAQRIAPSFKGTLLTSSAIGAASAILGLVAARVWALAAGGSIVLTAAALFIVCTVVGPRVRGMRTASARSLGL